LPKSANITYASGKITIVLIIIALSNQKEDSMGRKLQQVNTYKTMKKLLHLSKTHAGTVSLNYQNNYVRTSTAKTRTPYWSGETPTKMECEARLSGRG